MVINPAAASGGWRAPQSAAIGMIRASGPGVPSGRMAHYVAYMAWESTYAVTGHCKVHITRVGKVEHSRPYRCGLGAPSYERA